MQAPQILGIVIGLCLIGFGWLFRRFLVLKEKRTAGGVVFAILAYIGALSVLQNAIFPYASTWSWEGVFMVWSGFLGKALGLVILAFLGFVYKPNKVAGYVVALIAATMLTVIGST